MQQRKPRLWKETPPTHASTVKQKEQENVFPNIKVVGSHIIKNEQLYCDSYLYLVHNWGESEIQKSTEEHFEIIL